MKMRKGSNKHGNTLYCGPVRLRGGRDEEEGTGGREQNKHLHFEVEEEERVSKEWRARARKVAGSLEMLD